MVCRIWRVCVLLQADGVVVDCIVRCRKVFLVGIVLALWMVFTQIVLPVIKGVTFLLLSPQIQPQRLRAVFVSAILATTVAGVVFAVPVPFWSRAEGVVWLPEQSQVRAGMDGTIDRIVAAPEQTVTSGEALFETHDALLHANVRVLRAKLGESLARYKAALNVDRVQAGILEAEIVSVTAELEQAEAHADGLVVRSPAEGTFIVPQSADLLGRFVQKGTLLGYVADPARASIRVVVPQSDIVMVRHRTKRVEVKLASRLDETLSAVIEREVPAADYLLPSKALGSAGGGRIPVDPRDDRGVKAVNKVFQLDVALEVTQPLDYFGERVLVRLTTAPPPWPSNGFGWDGSCSWSILVSSSQLRASSPLRPGLALGRYPEKNVSERGWLERLVSAAGAIVMTTGGAGTRRYASIVESIRAHDKELQSLDELGIETWLRDLRGALLREQDDGTVIRTFALVRELAGRLLGTRHFDSQLLGGWLMHKGMLVEMETGEGKTLTATLPACTAALAGIPVHVITANEYLAGRDAELMRPVYEAMGLSVGCPKESMETEARKQEYACDVTYCTNKQVAFDYLRDRMVLSNSSGRLHLELERLEGRTGRLDRLMLRGLCFAIVDEADSVLVDEARTPLILSRSGDADAFERSFDEALEMEARLIEDDDFLLNHKSRNVELTTAGREKVAQLAEPLQGIWSGPKRREEMVCQALRARCLFARDRHYLVRDGKVQIIDEATGRLMPDRSWERGLHQMIQAKEGCQISTRNETLARLSYQRFFRRYLKLAGMSGTLREVAGELRSVYDLNVVRVPTHRTSRRRVGPTRVYASKSRKWEQVIEAVHACQRSGQPVLIGTPTVGDSEHLSARLTGAGLSHELLNARQDENEAQIVAGGGATRAGHGGDQHGGSRHRYRARSRGGRARRAARHPH